MDIREEATFAMRKVPRDLADNYRLQALVVACVGWGIPSNEIPPLIREYERGYPFEFLSPTEQQIQEAIASSSETVRPGQELTVTNYGLQHNEKGKPKRVPLSMQAVLEQINDITDNRIARADNVLFFDDPELGIHYFSKHGAAGVFGCLHSRCNVLWTDGSGFVKQTEAFAELDRTAKQYSAVEMLPHEPPVPGVYYGCATPKLGSGERLDQLLAFFSPASDLDAKLLRLLFLTAFWGGPPGTRPLFVVTSDEGRGAGKTSVFKVLAHLCHGMIEVSANEDMGGIKTRLLSPSGQDKRLLLLDNIKTMKFSWAELEALVTSPTVSGKRLYSGEGQRPNLLTIGLTLNGVNLSEDIAQRSVVVKVKRPIYAGNWFEEVFQFVEQYRDAIIGDILAGLQAETVELKSYTRWGTWEKNVLSRVAEANELQGVILERQHESNCDREEAQLIEDAFAEQLSRYSIDPSSSVVRISNNMITDWFGSAMNERVKTGAVTRKLKQMANEGQLSRLRPDPSRTYNRCWIWTGEQATPDTPIDNCLVITHHQIAAA